ncbi:Conserved hypothetical protein, secreted [Salinibacter ruber M8]|uniref:Uncharacterized protein n=1 Tax=Salinibacter ruber (strain M8) TaxID=761659 RepID=D5H4Z6_SALRM|nr:Conserved hypothetical protein, secreted [Salinibacter ruber M8]
MRRPSFTSLLVTALVAIVLTAGCDLTGGQEDENPPDDGTPSPSPSLSGEQPVPFRNGERVPVADSVIPLSTPSRAG